MIQSIFASLRPLHSVRPPLAISDLPQDTFTLTAPEEQPIEATPLMKLRAPATIHPAPLDSMEYKMLLTPSHFAHPGKGQGQFWTRLEKAAASAGLTATKCLDLVVKTRELSFLDTADAALRTQGFILRRRTNPNGKGNITLKYRDKSRTDAYSVDLTSTREGETKFEKDVVCKDAFTEVFSKSNKVVMSKIPKGALSNFSKVFPSLAKLGIASDVHLDPVQGRWIQEECHTLGDIEISRDVSVTALLNLWYEDNKPAIAEFSFTMRGHDMQAEKGAQKFMRAVEQIAPDWISEAQSKTEWAYTTPPKTVTEGSDARLESQLEASLNPNLG